MPIERHTAYKCAVKHLLKGRYIQKQGWEPSYVETIIGQISRANVTGVIVGQDGPGLILDDGTGQITLRSFEERNPLLNVGIGSKVLVVGRPRLYNDLIYLNVELAKQIDEKWLLLRKMELEQLKPTMEINTEKMVTPPIESTPSPGERILAAIQQLDRGEGVDIDEILQTVKDDKAENTLQMLLQEGEIFEIKPGRVKLL